MNGKDQSIEQKQGNEDILDLFLSSFQIAKSSLVLFKFANPWAVKFNFNLPVTQTVISGALWVFRPGEDPQKLSQGESFILPKGTGGKEYGLAYSPSKKQDWADPKDVFNMDIADTGNNFSGLNAPSKIEWGKGEITNTRVLSFALEWEDQFNNPLLDSLPEFVRLNADHTSPELLDMLARTPFDTTLINEPGVGAVTAATAQLFLTNALRSYALTDKDHVSGWMKVLSDPQLAQVLHDIHSRPGHKWSLDALAATVNMSRSVFTRRFSRMMGMTAMEYIRSWRMHIARKEIRRGQKTITALCHELGYESEAAFRRAFRIETEMSPRDYRKTL